MLYCRRVAGAIGRVCLAIFGAARPRRHRSRRTERLADDLGVALQLTNILRDVREDAENGRVYLPAEDLRRFGWSRRAMTPGRGRAATRGVAAGRQAQRGSEALVALVRFQAERAQQWFERGMELAPLLDRRSAACLLAMAGIYRRLLERIEADPSGRCASACRCRRARRPGRGAQLLGGAVSDVSAGAPRRRDRRRARRDRRGARLRRRRARR